MVAPNVEYEAYRGRAEAPPAPPTDDTPKSEFVPPELKGIKMKSDTTSLVQ
jgi:hypothetical protein